MFLIESPTERLDRLVFDGHRGIVEEGVSCWCPIGRHWIIYPLPDVVTEYWWLAYSNHMIDDHAQCSSAL